MTNLIKVKHVKRITTTLYLVATHNPPNTTFAKIYELKLPRPNRHSGMGLKPRKTPKFIPELKLRAIERNGI